MQPKEIKMLQYDFVTHFEYRFILLQKYITMLVTLHFIVKLFTYPL